MRRFYSLVLAVCAMSFMGHNVSAENADSIAIEIDSILATVDSIVADSVPEWYVAPEIPLSLRAPRRAAAAAASCTRVEAIQTFNIDSVLTEGTYYEYDAKGNVISTTVWTYNPDGTMTGKSKNEYAFDAAGTQTMTAVYIWDGEANDWKGTEKYEYVYKTFAGEKKMTSSTSSVWLNGAWVADQRFTYDYDASLREISYFEYRRNTSTNELQPVKGREQSWTDDLQTLEALYTAYANGKWTAGTKKEWAFDENGTQTLYATYTISNGAWVGSSKETWAYNTSSKLTLHEKYGWAGNDWSITLQENTTYDASGNTTLIENYSWSNGIKTGTKKEQYSFDGGKPVLTMVYAWSNGAWIGSSKEVWNYNASSKLTLHEKYGWANNDWSLTLQEKTVYSGANITLIENYTWSNGVKTGTKKEEYTYSGSLKTSFVTYSWAGSDWVGASKEIWAYTSGKQTLHETYAWGATDWSITLQENTAYSGANITKIENYTWTNGTKTGTQKEEYAYTGSQKTQEIIYAWTNDAWVESTKEVWGYTSGKLTHHETYTWGSSDWSILTQENTTYSGANIIRIENYEWVNGVKTGTQKEEYTYTSGEKTMTVVYAWANNDWVYSTKNEAGYRDGNVEVSATNYAWNGSAWVGTGTRTQTTYNSDQKVTEKLTKNWPSGATDWTNAAITTNTYNADGENIMTYNGTWNGSRWTVYSMTRTDIIFDEAGHQLLRASWRCGSDSVWTGIQKDTAAYTAANLLLYSAQYTSWKNNNWVASYRVEYEYDSANRITLNQRYDWKSNKWQGVYKYEYEYDSKGRQITSTTYTSWDTSRKRWIGTSKKVTEYYDNGSIKSYTDYEWGNNRWDPLFLYTYKYDGNGREIERIIQYYSGGSWVNMLKYENAYSGNKQTKSNSYSWINNQWVYSSRSESTYDEFSPETLRRQVNGTWAAGSLLSYSDDYYYYNCDPHFYTVRFVNYDGSVLESATAQEGETPVYSGSTPTKPADTENTYTFSGWNPTLGPVTSNVTYTATFIATKNTYTITWKNEDGTLIDQTTAEYGTMPTHEDASKANTAEYTYTFAGWNPGLGIVTGDASYTATYTATKKTYTVTWQYKDGTEIDHATYDYGVIPTHADAEKAATAEWTYTFKGWTPGMGMVTGDAVYTAEFDSIKNKYTVIFRNYDNTELQSIEVEYGVTPEYTGEDPTKPADAQDTYNFAGWDPQVVPVTGNATYTAQYTSTVNSYTIKFMNGETELQTSEVAYGEMPVYTGAKPTKDATAQYTYDFSGWDSEIVAVTGAKTYNAQFTGTVNSYVITFMNGEDILQSGEVAYGETPAYNGATPTKPADAQDSYTFAGWSPEIAAVTGTATYTATFTGTTNKYLITFKNGETELQSSEVDYGETPSYTGATPTKPADAQYTYTFSGWDPQVVAVIGSKTYTAQFSSTVNKYTIKFMNGETELQSSEVDYGETPVYTAATPTKDATAQYTYTFAGWDKEIASVTGDETYTAQFSSEVNSYTVTWVDENDIEISHETLEYGATPQHADASKQNTAEYTYTFTGWTPAIVDVTGDATYKATFSQTKNSYTVTWVDENDTEISHETLEYGTTPSHADMSKDNTAEWTYNFEGWTPAIVDVTGDATYKATFSQTKNSYVITFLNYDGTELQTGDVEYGVVPTYTSATPTKPADAQGTYTFAGWDEEIAAVTGAKTYTATFTGVKGTYTITFYFGDGVTILEQMELAYGEMPEMTLEPARLSDPEFSYTFAGWEPAIAPVTADADYVAVYTATTNSYTIIFRNDDGTELQREVLEYGILPIYAGEEPTKEEDERYTYEFAGWKPAVDIAKADAVYTATYTATKKKKQGIEDVIESGAQATKIYIEGNIYILRAGHAYAPDGTKLY